MKKIVPLVLIFFSIFFFDYSWAKTGVNPLFNEANSFYKQNKYDEAITAYEKIIRQGLGSGNLYYNLGNSYFKKGLLGKAVLNYERAKAFIPSDSDLKSNYEYALSAAGVSSALSGHWFLLWLDRLFEGLGFNALTIFVSVVYALFFLFLMLNMFFNSWHKFSKPLLWVLILLGVLAALSLQRRITWLNKGAVVISKEAEAKFEPTENATTYFKLTEGSRLEIIESSMNWDKIKRLDGKIGWVNKANIENIAVK